MSYSDMPTDEYHKYSFFVYFDKSMAWCETAISPLLTDWGYCSLTLSCRYITVSTAVHVPVVLPSSALCLGPRTNLFPMYSEIFMLGKFKHSMTVGFGTSFVPPCYIPCYFIVSKCKNIVTITKTTLAVTSKNSTQVIGLYNLMYVHKNGSIMMWPFLRSTVTQRNKITFTSAINLPSSKS